MPSEGRTARPAAEMRMLCWDAHGVAGPFTLYPVRVMTRGPFHDAPEARLKRFGLGGGVLIRASVRHRRACLMRHIRSFGAERVFVVFPLHIVPGLR